MVGNGGRRSQKGPHTTHLNHADRYPIHLSFIDLAKTSTKTIAMPLPTPFLHKSRRADAATESQLLVWNWIPSKERYEVQATLPFDLSENVRAYKTVGPLQCQFELARDMQNYLSKPEMEGWTFACVVSSGRKQLLPTRVDEERMCLAIRTTLILKEKKSCECRRTSQVGGLAAAAALGTDLWHTGAPARTGEVSHRPPEFEEMQ